MADKVQADQLGAQTSGVATRGNINNSNGTLNTGDQRRSGTADIKSVTGSVNVNNGISAESFGSLMSTLFSASKSSVEAATPSVLNLPTTINSGAAGLSDEAKKYIKYGLIAGGVLVFALVLRSFLKK